MGLDIYFYRQSKLDPRYKEELTYFRKVDFFINYFNIQDYQNCEYVKISKEEFERLNNDLKEELITHKRNEIPNHYRSEKCLEPSNDRLRSSFYHKYDSMYWDDIRNAWIFSNNVKKSLDWEKDDLLIYCCW